jgi:ubiquinone/menaquinone biosynthesis C-methylase UbiE
MTLETTTGNLRAEDIYRRRFAEQETFRDAMWKVLCGAHFQRFVAPDETVMEIAAGYCEFINNIDAARRIAVDINPETTRRAADGVEVVLTTSSDLSMIPDGTADVAFVSNFFEHITREEISETVREIHRCLAPGGRLLILQPNIRYVQRDYWMFFDHITAIDDRALCELLEILGFSITLNLPRFLPYTTQSRLPKSLALLRIYLRVPLLWKLFGGQAFIVATKNS